MLHFQLTNQVRQLVYETLREYGLPTETVPQESILLRGGMYCGRRFDAGDFHAIWFIEENQVKFYGPQGLLRKVSCPLGAPVAHVEMRAA